MTRPTPRRRSTPLHRTLAVLAWLAVLAQVVGVPIHLAADEHYFTGQDGAHVHFGAFGHGEQHAAHHSPRRDRDRDHDHDHDHEAARESTPFVPSGCENDSSLPPHSALDHLIDTDLRRELEPSVPAPQESLHARIEGSRFELAPRPERRVAHWPPAPPPRGPQPRRPEQSRAPPIDLV